MTILDLILLSPILVGGYWGWRDGVLDDVVAALHFAIAFAISFKVLSVAFFFLDKHIFTFTTSSTSSGVNSFSALLFAASVGVTLVLLNVFGKFLKTEIVYDFPGAWDNIAGMIFGGVRYMFVMSFTIWFLQAFGEFNIEMKNKSILYKRIESISYTIIGVNDAREMSKSIRVFSGVEAQR